LNDLSSSWPMSVTIPTFRAAALGAALAVALALAATLGLGLGLLWLSGREMVRLWRSGPPLR